MTSSINYGFDDIRKRREQNNTEKQRLAAIEEKTRYDNIHYKHTQNQQKRLDKQEKSRSALQSSGYDFQDLSGYDHSSAGNKKFDNRDYKYLKSQGRSNEDINKYISGLDASQLHEGIRYNKNRAGKHYVGDHDRNTKLISDFDTGKGYNASDIKYLEKQGYTKAEIAEDMVNRASKFGKTSADFLKEQGRFDDWDTADQGRRASAKEKAQAHKAVSSSQPAVQGQPAAESGAESMTPNQQTQAPQSRTSYGGFDFSDLYGGSSSQPSQSRTGGFDFNSQYQGSTKPQTVTKQQQYRNEFDLGEFDDILKRNKY